MKATPLLYYFTATWAYTPSVTEIKDNGFCKSLFGKPEITTSAIGPAGFFIMTMQPTHLNEVNVVIISQQQLQLVTNNAGIIPDVLEKVAKKMIELNPLPFNFSFLSSTYAIDCEISNFNVSNTSNWLSQKFLEKNFKIIEDFKSAKISVVDIMFALESSDTQKTTFQIQPRTNKEDSLFIKTTEENKKKTSDEFYKKISLSYSNLFKKISKQSKNLVSNG